MCAVNHLNACLVPYLFQQGFLVGAMLQNARADVYLGWCFLELRIPCAELRHAHDNALAGTASATENAYEFRI